MKLLIIFLTVIMLDAKILEVKQLFNFQAVKVEKTSIGIKKSFYAKTAIDESKIKALTLRFDAFVNRLYADKLYDSIKKGEPLFNIYSKEVSNTLEEYIVSKSISKKARKNALLKLRLLNVKELAKHSKPVYDFDFVSPYSGYIIEKNIIDGGFIKKGKTILKIADFSILWVIAKVYQKDISFIEQGMAVEVDVKGYESVKGVVDFIYPNIDPKDQALSVRIVIDNKDLKYVPNLFAKVYFKQDATTMLKLPKTAVLKKGDRYYVFVPVGKKGEFEPKIVTAKRVDSSSYQIVTGLKEGDTVIDNALFMLDSDAVTNALYESEDDDW